LVVTTLVAIGFYVFFVRPTVLAKQFVQAAVSGKFDSELQSQFAVNFWDNDKQHICWYDYALLLPREWSDVWKCQHRVQAIASSSKMQVVVTVVAGPFRLRPTGHRIRRIMSGDSELYFE
jgi:hypothetical protein